ncbi:MAG: hypothetical protein ACI9TV_002133, partial [Sulfurimonas sp.]
MKATIFKTDKLPFVELRYIREVTSCDKQHQHDELTITAIEFGSINILFNTKQDTLQPYSLCIVNPNEIHCATLSNLESRGCYVLYIDK